MTIIGIGICENLLLGIGIGSVGVFLYQWNPNARLYKECIHKSKRRIKELMSGTAKNKCYYN